MDYKVEYTLGGLRIENRGAPSGSTLFAQQAEEAPIIKLPQACVALKQFVGDEKAAEYGEDVDAVLSNAGASFFQSSACGQRGTSPLCRERIPQTGLTPGCDGLARSFDL